MKQKEGRKKILQNISTTFEKKKMRKQKDCERPRESIL